MPFNEQTWKETFHGHYQGWVGFDVALSGHTSLGIGGPADVFATPEDPLSLRNILVVFKERKVSYFTLGGGTNLLVKDGGINGVVISLKAFKRIEILKEGKTHVEMFVEAGVPWQKLVNFCREKGYSGIEGLTGIPGTVGGAICGNAGSFGCETKDVVASVAIMDSDGRLDRYKAEGFDFGYRTSDIPQTDIILSANLRLKIDDKNEVARRTDGFFQKKRLSQPISEKSAGCVFKNPEGVSAGKLIDEAGCKGIKRGGVEVSRLHANFFINTGDGTASDFILLMHEVAEKVKKNTGIVLENEIRIMGRDKEDRRDEKDA